MLRYSARWPRSLTHRLLYIARPSRQRIPLHESVVPPLLRFMVCGVTCLSAVMCWLYLRLDSFGRDFDVRPPLATCESCCASRTTIASSLPWTPPHEPPCGRCSRRVPTLQDALSTPHARRYSALPARGGSECCALCRHARCPPFRIK